MTAGKAELPIRGGWLIALLTALAALGDDSPWLPWRAYCVQRGQEVIEGYGLEAPAEEAVPES